MSGKTFYTVSFIHCVHTTHHCVERTLGGGGGVGGGE